MKLYATTTSERASKGQGGEWLEIKISNENSEQITHFSLKIGGDGIPQLKVYYKIGKIRWVGAEPWEVFTEEMESTREQSKGDWKKVRSPSGMIVNRYTKGKQKKDKIRIATWCSSCEAHSNADVAGNCELCGTPLQ